MGFLVNFEQRRKVFPMFPLNSNPASELYQFCTIIYFQIFSVDVVLSIVHSKSFRVLRTEPKMI